MAKYKSTLNEIVKGAGITFITGMIGYVLMFLFKLLIARNLTPSDYGSFELLNTIFGVLVAISALGISSSVPRYVPYYKAKKEFFLLNGFLKFSFVIPVVVSVLLSVVFFYFSSHISFFFNLDEQFVFFLKSLCFILPLRIISEIIHVHFNANKKIFFGSFSFNIINKSVLFFGVLILLFTNFDLAYVVLVFIFSFIFMFLFDVVSFFIKSKDMYSFKNRSDYKLKEWLYFSIPLLLTGFFAFVFNWTDNFVIAKFLTSADLGIYGVAYSLASYLFFIPGLFSSIFLPILTELYADKSKNTNKIIFQVRSWIVLASIFLGTIMIIFSEQIIFSLFGPAYVSGSSSFAILSAFFLISNYLSFGSFILIIKNKTNKLFLNYFIFTVLNLTLNILFISIFKSIFVVALTSGVCVLLLRVFENLLSKKKNLVFIDKWFVIKSLFASLFSAILVKLSFILLNFIAISELIKLGIGLGLYSLSFLSFVKIFKLLSKTDLNIIELILNKIGLSFLVKSLRKFYK